VRLSLAPGGVRNEEESAARRRPPHWASRWGLLASGWLRRDRHQLEYEHLQHGGNHHRLCHEHVDHFTSEASTTTSETSTTVSGTSTTAVTSAAKAVRYEQSDSHLAYEGRWKIGANAAASGGRYTFADHAGCSVTINFDGTYLSLIAKKSHNYGKASVTLDGTVVATIDLYSVNATYQRKVWNTGTLASGVHKVTIAWTGKKRTAALAANINIDAVDVIGTLQ
jgi:hypothetical protein